MPSGTLWKLEGTQAWFYSKRGAWQYPSTVGGDSPVPVDQLTVGHKYDVQFKPFQVLQDMGANSYFQEDCSAHGLNASQRGQAVQTAPSAPAQPSAAPAPSGRSHKDAEISATAVVKSCLEGGHAKSLNEAFIAGLRWSALWHDLPPGVQSWLEAHDPTAEQVRAAVQQATQAVTSPAKEDLNDDIPF